MNYDEAQKYSFTVPWIIKDCISGSDCWCRIIAPAEPIMVEKEEAGDSFLIIGDGAVDKKTAEYIVQLHNDKLGRDKIILHQLNCLKESKLDKDYGESQ